MKTLFWIFLSSCLISCSIDSTQYYKSHPKELQEALQKCPTPPSPSISCEQLQQMAVRIDKLAFSLRSNPQEYGLGILSLQEKISQQESMLQQKDDPALQEQLKHAKEELEARIVVVKWLESPNS
jgi:chromosome segregation ATPase